MAMRLTLADLTDEARARLKSPRPADAFRSWLEGAPEWVRLGFSGLGARPGTGQWDDLVRDFFSTAPEHLARFLEAREWPRAVEMTMNRSAELLGDTPTQVIVAVLVGLGRRNAHPGLWRGRGYAFVFLEHFLPPGSNSGWLDLGVDAIPIWLGHEIGHAVRYSAPGTRSLVPRATEGVDPWLFWDVVESLPLRERFLDEGLATAFSRAVAPASTDEAILGMSPHALEWLEAHGAELLRRRASEWDLDCANPPSERLRDALWDERDRWEPPWTFDRPPSRWGYFAGERFFAPRCEGHWRERLSACSRSTPAPNNSPWT